MSVNDARMFVFAQGDELLDINGSLVDGDGDYAGIMSVIGHLDEDYELARYTARDNNSEVVEMVRKPEPVVVSEEESEMLKKASNLRDWRPAAVISEYAYEHEGYSCDDEVLLEDRLMRAYVNGYTVAKEKKYYVKVPHTQKAWYYQYGDTDLLTICPADKELRGKFTESEIEHYGLQDCEKLELTGEE